jgi:hypothetical protein
MTLLSVSGEDRETVQGFVEKHGATYPIFYKAQSGDYSTGSVPTAYLIGADGTVVWHGHPAGVNDDILGAELKNVAKDDRVSTWEFSISKALPNIPASMSGVKKLLVKMKFGGALKKVEGALAKLEGDDKAAGEQVLAWISKNAETDLEKAAEFVREGQIYKGYMLYGDVEVRFKGHDLAKQAKASAGALKKGKETKLEIKASEKFEKIKAEMRDERKNEDKLACLKPLLGKKYAETLAGKQAAELAKTLGG